MATLVRKQPVPVEARVTRMPLEATFVEIMDLQCLDRRLQLMTARSRAIRRHDIHELMITDELDARPGDVVEAVEYIGFVEFPAGGMLVYGDAVVIGGREVGVIAGFDECHFPNHYNVVVKGPKRVTGFDLDQHPGDPVVFIPAARE